LICTKLCWQIPSESGESSSFFSTRNAFIRILSSCVILPIKMQKQVVILKDIILKAKANKYQQNQTILP